MPPTYNWSGIPGDKVKLGYWAIRGLG